MKQGYMETWKYNIKRNSNSGFPIATMRKVAVILYLFN